MFTGLIEDVGRVTAIVRRGTAAVLSISTALPSSDTVIGDSVAVNGACLTVTALHGSTFSFDVSPETLASTTLEGLKTGSRVNLERALRLGDRLGGHIVTGHIDCIGRLLRSSETSGNHVLDFGLPAGKARYLISKGSVAINGVSLTVNNVGSDHFSVNIIPLSWKSTNLADLKPGETVNIETDIIGKYVERLTAAAKPGAGLSMSTLAENGFI
jgi:riboflavin synthase